MKDNLKIKLISSDLINEDPNNSKIFSMDGIDLLAYDIKSHGLLTPLEVYPLPDSNEFMIRQGHRRFRACRKLKIDYIPCYVIEYESSDNRRLQALIRGNLMTRNLSAVETARSYSYYLQSLSEKKMPKMKKIEVMSELTGASASTIRKYLNLLELIPQLQEKANDSEHYSYSALSLASTLSEEEQSRLDYELDSNVSNNPSESVSRNQIMAMIRQIKSDRSETVISDSEFTSMIIDEKIDFIERKQKRREVEKPVAKDDFNFLKANISNFLGSSNNSYEFMKRLNAVLSDLKKSVDDSSILSQKSKNDVYKSVRDAFEK